MVTAAIGAGYNGKGALVLKSARLVGGNMLRTENDRSGSPVVYRFVFVILVAITLPVMSLTAQTNQGSIAGTVYDSTGAAVDGARIVARNVNTGGIAETNSSGGGGYRFPALQAGRYDLTVTIKGFSRPFSLLM